MTNELKNLFATESNMQATTGRGLTGTAQLTSVASSIAAQVIDVMNSDIEQYADDIRKSQADNNAMDALVESIRPLTIDDGYFLATIADEVIDGMLKSQQSKRSRCKSKAMTMDNYKSMMTAAIAENIIRLVTGKEKNASSGSRMSGSAEYTIEQLEELAADQDRLKKEIRNVQSKKSIMKSKAGFDESDERWQQLLKVERQLKDMRSSAATEIVEVDHTKDALSELLSNVNVDELHAKDSKELLAAIAALLK